MAALLAVACAGCRGGDQDIPSALPETLHGLELVEHRSGDDAATFIEHLHEKSVAPVESNIGIYGVGEMQAMLYVSHFASAPRADSVLAVMAEKIGTGSSGYGHHTVVTIAGTQVHGVLGHGQVHYFYTKGSDLTWLSVPPPLARPALAELLGVELKEVSREDVTTT
jgi:hypothetical protein